MITSSLLRESSLAQEGPLLVSKAIKIPVLMDSQEMEALFQTMESSCGAIGIYSVQGVCKKGEGVISKESFFKAYVEYIEYLKRGEIPPEKEFRPLFSSILSTTHTILYAMPVGPEEQLIKSTRPVLQLQMNHIHYSKEDDEFRPMAFGSEGISWGIQFSYPQLFQDPKSQEICPVRESPEFPNTSLFKTLQRWIRHHTIPTPFIVNGKKRHVPIRIGKQCLHWIHFHPQLKQRDITVYHAS